MTGGTQVQVFTQDRFLDQLNRQRETYRRRTSGEKTLMQPNYTSRFGSKGRASAPHIETPGAYVYPQIGHAHAIPPSCDRNRRQSYSAATLVRPRRAPVGRRPEEVECATAMSGRFYEIPSGPSRGHEARITPS